jgi:hypothetical protein
MESALGGSSARQAIQIYSCSASVFSQRPTTRENVDAERSPGSHFPKGRHYSTLPRFQGYSVSLSLKFMLCYCFCAWFTSTVDPTMNILEHTKISSKRPSFFTFSFPVFLCGIYSFLIYENLLSFLGVNCKWKLTSFENPL